MNKALRYILGGVAIVVILLLVWYFRSIVGYIIIAAVFSFLGRPLVALIKRVRIKKFTVPNWLAALLALAVIWALAITFFAIFIPIIFSKISDLASLDIQSFVGSFQEPLAKFENFLEEYFSISASTASITEGLVHYVSELFDLNKLNSILSSLFSIVVSTGVAVFSITFITFFFLKDENLFLRILMAITPTKYEGNIKHALGSINRLLSRYFVGILAESTAIMLIVSISLICCGYTPSNAFFIGIIVGVLNVIPYVGPWIGFGISLLVSIAFVSSGMSMTFIFFSLAITVLAAQMIDNFLLQPFLYSNSVNAHPLEIFIVILMAGQFAGVFGMLLAIPAYTVLRVIAKEFFNNFKIVQKLTENME